MTKKREYKNKQKKRMIWVAIITLIMILAGIGLFLFLRSEELTVLNDTTAPPNHKDFIGYNYYENTEIAQKQQFVFVDDPSSNINNYFTKSLYEYKYSAGIQYYKGNDVSLLAGRSCDQQQLIRFSFCDNAYDKSKCTTDIFDNLWLVNTFNDYPNFAEYYTGDNDGFYYTYSCYEREEYKAITVDDSVEKRYLYNDKCISADDPNWSKGDNYNTEDECLKALMLILEAKQDEAKDESCTSKVYDEFVCKTNNLYQKERLTDCSIGYTEFVKRCDYGCSDGSCDSAPLSTCDYIEYDEFKCIGDVEYQKVQNRDCSIGFTLPIDSCTLSDSIDLTTNNTDTPEVSIYTQTGGGAGVIVVECRGYETITEDNECSFDISVLFSDKGVTDAWTDYKTGIIIGIIVVVILILSAIPYKGGTKK